MNIPPKLRSAFPVPAENADLGITIMDYFAAHALAGLLANPKADIYLDDADPDDLTQTAFRIAYGMVGKSELWRDY